MSREQLYKVSKSLTGLRKNTESFWNTHAFRYAHFVDSSDLGLDCRYAQATLEGFKNEREHSSLRKILLEMRATIDMILGALDES